MNRQRAVVVGAFGIAALLATGAPRAWASPSSPAAVAQTASSPSGVAATSPPSSHPHASIRVDIARPSAWTGQAIPIVVTARFRDVERVTLEGVPELKSDGVFTSNLSREPQQSNENVGGASVLVATWSGTVTPSTPGPLALSVELPVHLRFQDVVAQPAMTDPMNGDPFAGMTIDPSDPAAGMQQMMRSFQQSFSRSFGPTLGQVHDDAVTLRASSRPVAVQPLPTEGQPAAFSGAVGRFDVRVSVPSDHLQASEPVTLRIAVQGDGDLDRVDLAGVATSADWKAYPTTSKVEPAAPGKKLGRKVFEQVLIPMHGGALTIPSVALSMFDPVSGRYASVSGAPLAVTVEGPAVPANASGAGSYSAATGGSGPAATAEPVEAAPPPGLPMPLPSSLVVAPRTLALCLAPMIAVVLLAFGVRSWRQRRRDDETSLRRALHQSARKGSAAAFFDAARRLIAVHFARRWGITEAQVTSDLLHAYLGPTAEPLVAVLSSADALRFGRRDFGSVELRSVCTSIESCLQEAR